MLSANAPPRVTDAPGSSDSPGDLLAHFDIERLFGNQLLELAIRALDFLPPIRF